MFIGEITNVFMNSIELATLVTDFQVDKYPEQKENIKKYKKYFCDIF